MESNLPSRPAHVKRMASLPPPCWSGRITDTVESLSVPLPKTSTQIEYLTFLRHECRRQGLVDWKDELTDTDVLAAIPFQTDRYSTPPHHITLTKEQWADPSNSINNSEFQKIDWAQQVLEQPDDSDDDNDDDDDEPTDQEVEQTSQDDAGNAKRTAVLQMDAPLHLQTITDNTRRDYLAAGGTQQRLDEIEREHPANTILYWLAELWKLPDPLKLDNDPKNERFRSISVFCDLPQENCRVVHGKIPSNETWPGFTARMKQQLLVRYLVTTHHPAVAETLFVDDDTIWPPEGLLPLRNEDDSIVHPEQYTKRADLAYDNGPGRGWWALVHPKKDSDELLTRDTDWKAVDSAADWDSVMEGLTRHREATVAFRHQSTKERMEFVAQKRREEETVLEWPGYVPFNCFLDRHWEAVEDPTPRCGRPREEECRRGDELGMAVPADRVRRQSAASKEMDAKAREGGGSRPMSMTRERDRGAGDGCVVTTRHGRHAFVRETRPDVGGRRRPTRATEDGRGIRQESPRRRHGPESQTEM